MTPGGTYGAGMVAEEHDTEPRPTRQTPAEYFTQIKRVRVNVGMCEHAGCANRADWELILSSGPLLLCEGCCKELETK